MTCTCADGPRIWSGVYQCQTCGAEITPLQMERHRLVGDCIAVVLFGLIPWAFVLSFFVF